MTLILSMNPFLDAEGDTPLPQYQPIWESERCTKICASPPVPPGGPSEQLAEEPHCRRMPDHMTMSRIAYFKRKYVEDEDPYLSFRSYCQTVAPALEERAHVLRLSLEKMRFIDDPEAFLRRSVLVNNLLRRLRAEILLQSDWCLPPGPGLPPAIPPRLLPPAASAAHQALSAAPPRPCPAPQGPPFRKRFRLVRGGGGDLRPECVQTCCCFYAAAAAASGHYLHLPFSVYEREASACASTPHSSSSLFQLENSQSRLGPGLDIDDDDEEEEEEEEEEKEEEEVRLARLSAQAKVRPRLRSRTRTLRCRRRKRAVEESKRRDKEQEEEEEDEEEEEEEESTEGHSRWDSNSLEKGRLGRGVWHHRGQRQ